MYDREAQFTCGYVVIQQIYLGTDDLNFMLVSDFHPLYKPTDRYSV